MRKQALESNLNKENKVTTTINSLQEADKKFEKRTLQDLDNAIEDAEKELKVRMGQEAELDASVVEVLFAGIQKLKDKKTLYQNFFKYIAE